ncbi:MAG: hypothetical protein ACRENZ_09265 [Thermodesulfobacteriota bacterium]
MSYTKRFISLLSLLIIVVSMGLLSCDGGGEGGGQPSGDKTTIRGSVSNVIAMGPADERSSTIMAKIKDFLSILKKANAQDGSNIVVTCLVNGSPVQTVDTDADGEFVCEVPISPNGNVVTLNFEMDGESESFVFVVPPGIDVVFLVVILNFPQNDVEATDMEFEGSIRCEDNEIIEINMQDDTEFVLDGDGGDCILTAGNCSVIIHHENITLTGCNTCVDARGNSSVEFLTNNGDIVCEATKECVISRGTASVMMDAIGGNITLNSDGDNCIRADGTSEMELNSSGDCTIIPMDGIIIDGTPTVAGNCFE